MMFEGRHEEAAERLRVAGAWSRRYHHPRDREFCHLPTIQGPFRITYLIVFNAGPAILSAELGVSGSRRAISILTPHRLT
jgi:hypothetical protein